MEFSIKRTISYVNDPDAELERHLDYMLSLSVDDRLRVLYQINKNTFAMQGIDYDRLRIKKVISLSDEE
jgi:hypothetical protein